MVCFIFVCAIICFTKNKSSHVSTRDGQKTYKFSKDEEALGHLIISIARGKAKHGIKHWGVSQASLEDAYVTGQNRNPKPCNV